MWVKVCGLMRAADVEAAIGAGADAVGFVLADSPRRVSLALARRLSHVATGRALTVAVVVDPSTAGLAELAGFDAVQLHGGLAPRPRGLRLLRALDPDGELDTEDADWVLVDGSRGRGRASDWTSVARRPWPVPLVVAGGLHPGNVAQVVAAVAPFGVDVSSGVEAAPGVKDPGRMRDFVAAARSA